MTDKHTLSDELRKLSDSPFSEFKTDRTWTIADLRDALRRAAGSVDETPAEVNRLRDLHLELTKLTERVILERDSLKQQLDQVTAERNEVRLTVANLEASGIDPAALNETIQRAEQAEAREAVLREALEWYGRGCHVDHSHGHPSGTYLKVEDGVRARQALAKQDK